MTVDDAIGLVECGARQTYSSVLAKMLVAEILRLREQVEYLEGQIGNEGNRRLA